MPKRKAKSKCTKCGLHRGRQHVKVPGRGPKPCDVMIIGQAPGEREDNDGECFVGPAGQLLEMAIREYGLEPAYLTNAVKCYPPDDRDPKPDEIKACIRYLHREIDRVKPKTILVLGNVALKALTGRTGITSWSGTKVGKFEEADVFAVIHPAYVLRKTSALARFERDMKEFAYHTGRMKKPKVISDIQEVGALYLKDAISRLKPPISFDFETTGKFKSDGGRIRCFSISDGKKAFWLECERNWSAAHWAIGEFLKMKVKKSAHNLAFELRWCLDEWGIEPEGLVNDTMLMHYLINENRGHALDAVASEYLDAPGWDIYPKMREKGWTYATVPMKVLGPYCAMDSLWTARLVGPLKEALKKTPSWKLYKQVVRPLAKVCARLEHRGVFVDARWARRVDDLFAHRMTELEAKLEGRESVRKLIKELKKAKKELNLNSDHQMRRLFFGILKLDPPEKTEGGKGSVREAALLKIRDKSPLIEPYLAWKGMKTLRNNFLQKWPRFRSEKDGLVHASFNPAFVVTGRLSVTNPPLQAAPEDPLVRGLITSRFPRGRILSADYRQLEIRLVASESGEKVWIKAIRAGKDIHDATARLIFGEKFTKQDRSIAKRINFGIVYGITEYGLSKSFQMSVTKAATYLTRFKRKAPRIYVWMKKMHALVQRDGKIENRFGRVRRLEEIRGMDKYKAERIFRQAGNFPIQALGADITNLAAVLVDRALRKAGLRSMLVHQVHDSLLIDVHPDEREEVKDLCVRTMTADVQARCPFLKVPLEIDMDMSKRWGKAKEVPNA